MKYRFQLISSDIDNDARNEQNLKCFNNYQVFQIGEDD